MHVLKISLMAMTLLFSITIARALDSENRPTVAEFELSNGLQIIVVPDRRAPVVTHSLWYKVGAADDPAGKSGLAHFLEHLLFKGTSNVPKDEFSRAVSEIGGQENAFTSSDYTGYYQKIPPEALEQMMFYEADRMRNLVLTEDIVAPELQVILEERGQRIDNSPGAIMSEFVNAALYIHHPYGTPVIGWEHEIEKLTLQDAIAFYDKWYQPNNATLIVVGDVEPENVLALAKKTYGKIPKADELSSRSWLKEPKPVAARSVEYRDRRVTTPSFGRGYLAPSYYTAEAGEAEALDLLSAILGGSSTSRLHTELVLEKEMATSAGAYYQGSSRGTGRFGFYASPRGETTIEELEAAAQKVVDDVLKDGVLQEELDRQREIFLRSQIFSRDNQGTLVRIYGSVLSNGGTVASINNWPDQLRKVTIEQVNAVARKYLQPKRSVTNYLLPEEK